MEALNVLVGCTCDKFLGRFQSRLLTIFFIFCTCKSIYCLYFTLLTWVGHDDGYNLLLIRSTTTHAHTHTAPYCLHSRYLFLRWIVSEAERLHGDGSPQIRMRKRERRRRLQAKAMIPAYLPPLYTCWHIYCIYWYGFTGRWMHSLSFLGSSPSQCSSLRSPSASQSCFSGAICFKLGHLCRGSAPVSLVHKLSRLLRPLLKITRRRKWTVEMLS